MASPHQDSDLERVRSIHREDYTTNIAESAERLRYQIEFAQSALKSLLLVNGAAVVSLLTMIGNSVVKFDKIGVWWSFFWFSSGIIMVLGAHFWAFFSQSSFMHVAYKQAWNSQREAIGLEPAHDFSSEFKRGNLAFILGVGFALGSAAFFVMGAFVALSAIL